MLLPVAEHQHRRISLGCAVGRSRHRFAGQAVALPDRCVAQIPQFRLFVVALLIKPRVNIGGRSAKAMC
jgi:hypothetical protein